MMDKFLNESQVECGSHSKICLSIQECRNPVRQGDRPVLSLSRSQHPMCQ